MLIIYIKQINHYYVMGRVTETYRGVMSDYVRTNKKKVVGKSFWVANASIVFHGARTLIVFCKLLLFFLSRKPSLKKKSRKQGCLVFDPGLWC